LPLSSSKEELLSRAQRELQAGNGQGAIEIYSRLTELYPEDPLLWFSRGMVVGMSGEYPEAVQHVAHAIHLGYETDEVYYNQGVLLSETGNFTQAIQAFRKAVTLNPDILDANNGIGLAYVELGDYESAAEYFSEEIRLHPQHVAAYLNTGRVYVRQNRLEAAEKYYRMAYSVDPDSEEVNKALAANARRLKRTEEAIRYYDRARKLSDAKDDYVYYTSMALTLDEHGVYDILGRECTFDYPILVGQPAVEIIREAAGSVSPDVLYYMVGGHIAPLANLMTRSVSQVSGGHVNIVQLSDSGTRSVPLADAVWRMEIQRDELIFCKHQLYAAYIRDAVRDIVILDTDIIVQSSLADVFGDWDIGLTLRHETDSLRKIMPFNEGVIFCRATEGARRFWGALLHVYEQLPTCLRRWSGGQISLGILLRKYLEEQEGDLLEVRGIRIKLLPKDIYNYAPEREDEDLSDRVIVHYHGPRKAWMLSQHTL